MIPNLLNKSFSFLIVCLLVVSIARGQSNDPYAAFMEQHVKKNPILVFLNQFSISFTAGYGRTFYRHNLPGYGVINKSDSLYSGLYLFNLADSTSTSFTGYQYWANAPVGSTVTRFENIDTDNQVLSDTARLGYKGHAGTLPFTLVIQYNFLERFRIGGGLAYEWHRLPDMTPFSGKQRIGAYEPNIRSTHFLRYFGMVGGKIYQIMDWSYFMDIQIGKVKMGRAFDKATTSNGLFFNIGFPIEYEFSEYFRAVIRPSYELKNYQVSLDLGNITHRQPALYVHFGFRYTIPEMPRCPLRAKDPAGYDYPKNFTNKTCRIQKKHVHGDKGFRGQPFYKKQNPKIGENDPNLHKYKLFNKRNLGGGY